MPVNLNLIVSKIDNQIDKDIVNWETIMKIEFE